MNNKKQIIILIVCTILVFILTKACSDILMDKMRTDIENETAETISNEVKEEYAKDWEDSIEDFLEGKIDYADFPLSDKYKKKYKTIQDIFGRDGEIGSLFENLYFENYSENMENILTLTYKTGNGFEEIAYQLHYVINEKNELDDIEIINSRVFQREDGSYPRYIKYEYYYDYPDSVTWALCYPYVRVDRDVDYYRVYVTDNFIKKFPNYLTTGVTGDTDYIMFGEHYQDENDKNVCYAEFLGLEWIKTYKLTYDIDEKGYVNDIDVELYEKHKTEDPEYIKSYYQEYLENVR